MRIDVCIKVSIENDGTSDATERQVVSAGFASTLAITTPGTGLQYEDEEGNVETSGDFTGVEVTVTDPSCLLRLKGRN